MGFLMDDGLVDSGYEVIEDTLPVTPYEYVHHQSIITLLFMD